MIAKNKVEVKNKEGVRKEDGTWMPREVIIQEATQIQKTRKSNSMKHQKEKRLHQTQQKVLQRKQVKNPTKKVFTHIHIITVELKLFSFF